MASAAQPAQPERILEKPPPVISSDEAVPAVISEMRSGSLAAATRNYLNCVDDCYQRYADGRIEHKPLSWKFKKRLKWRTQNKLLNRCLERCKDNWNKTVIDLIGEANFNLNKDVLSHILTMLLDKNRVKKRKRSLQEQLSQKKEGGRKTRRKKGTRRKRRRRKRKSKTRRNTKRRKRKS